MEQLLTMAEVSKILNVSQSTLRNWDKARKLTPIRTFGKHRRYTHTQIDNFIQGYYTAKQEGNQDASKE